jgi:hypothetical protein
MSGQTDVLLSENAQRLLLDIADGWKPWKAAENSPFRLLPGGLDLKGRPRSSFPISDAWVRELIDRRLIEMYGPSNAEYRLTDRGSEYLQFINSARS